MESTYSQFYFEETGILSSSIIPKNDNSQKTNGSIEELNVNSLRKEQNHEFRRTVHDISTTNPQNSVYDVANVISAEQYPRRTVKFDDDKSQYQILSNRSFRASYINQDSIPNDLQTRQSMDTRYSFDGIIEPNRSSLGLQDNRNIISEEEYIPGGFANLDRELEEEFLNNFADDIDDETKRRTRQISSNRPSDHIISITRSPIELWKRARILIALHIYKDQNKTLKLHSNTFSELNVDDQRNSKEMNEINYLEKLFEQKQDIDERKLTFGISIIEEFSLNSSLQYKCVDFYDVGQGYIIICNVINLNQPQLNIKDYSNLIQRQSHKKTSMNRCEKLNPISNRTSISSSEQSSGLLVYSIDKKSSHKLQSIEFECPFQFDFMICVPILRLILGFINLKQQKSLMTIIGDASRKGVFLSKQEIPDHIHSILYIHESTILFIGCMGRVLSYNTQPLQVTSQPSLISELTNLPFQPMEPILHMCQVTTHRAVGLLSNRYFVLYQYTPDADILIKFCNPHRYEFIRCHYNSKFNYVILGFIDGLILIYHINQMKQIRRYQHHWKMITDLAISQDQNLLFSCSTDHLINIWNLETLQHLYHYNTNEEIFQIDIIHENLFYYRSLKHIILFELYLKTILFSITKSKVKSLKLFTDMQRIARVIAISENDCAILISPVSGCCLTYMSNIAEKPIKQILHDISRSSIYSLHVDGEIVYYRTDNNPCIAEYRIQTKSESSAITCMTLINPMRTQLFNIRTMETSVEKSLEKQIIFFGHANGYISLFQGDSFIMEPILAHNGPILCLETSRISTETTNILFTNCEVLLSCSIDRIIHIWNLSLNKSDESIELIHILTIEQEKNISLESIKFLSMIDNFIVANYSDQKYLHVWQLLNISIQINVHDQWGIVEHPTKGVPHRSQIHALSTTPTLKLFASSDTEGVIKLWDKTNSLLREIYLDKSLCAMEFLSQNGELIIAYQDNIHLILPEKYIPNYQKTKTKQQIFFNIIAENDSLEVVQPLIIPYESLPIFHYRMKTHHSKKRLKIFEQQLAGRFAVIEHDSSQSEDENPLLSSNIDRLSIVSDEPDWLELAEDVKDILRMKKHEIRHQNKQSIITSAEINEQVLS